MWKAIKLTFLFAAFVGSANAQVGIAPSLPDSSMRDPHMFIAWSASASDVIRLNADSVAAKILRDAFRNNTETLITATWQVADNTIDLVVDEASINHDNLTGFVVAEHVDWSLASQGTIHATNYVDNNDNTNCGTDIACTFTDDTWNATAVGTQYGGTGQNFSASTGVVRLAAGTASADAGISHLAASTSADLLGVLSDETGTGFAVFGTGPTIAAPVITDKVDRNNVAVNDDDCTGEQGLWWYDTTDSRFEFCNDNSGTPTELGGVDTGDEVTVEEAGVITATSGPVFADSTDINFGINAPPTYDRIFATINEAGVTQHEAALSIATTQLTGSVTDAQVPDNITIDLATTATTANNLAADGLDAMSEIAAGIKRGPDATDTHILTTDVAAPGALTCLEMDTDGSVVLAGAACGTGGGATTEAELETDLTDVLDVATDNDLTLHQMFIKRNGGLIGTDSLRMTGTGFNVTGEIVTTNGGVNTQYVQLPGAGSVSLSSFNLFGFANPQTTIVSSDSVLMFIDSNNNGTTSAFTILKDGRETIGVGGVEIFSIRESGDVSITGSILGASIDGSLIDAGIVPAARVGSDHIDALAEIATALKSGLDATLITGTAGGTGNCAEWDANGDLIDSGAGCGGGSGDNAFVNGTGLADINLTDSTGTANGGLCWQENRTASPDEVSGYVCANAVGPDEVDETSAYSFTTIDGKQLRNNTPVDDDSCVGEQGTWWYDTTDSAFEFCNADSGAPTVLGGFSPTDIDTDYGTETVTSAWTMSSTTNAFTGATFTSGAPDPGDAGVLRLGNTEQICWEAAPAGTEVCISVDASEIVQITGGTIDLADGSGVVPDASVDGSAERDEVCDTADLDASCLVIDDSHNHIITNIDAFTETELTTQTSTVSDFATEDDLAHEQILFDRSDDLLGTDSLQWDGSAGCLGVGNFSTCAAMVNIFNGSGSGTELQIESNTTSVNTSIVMKTATDQWGFAVLDASGRLAFTNPDITGNPVEFTPTGSMFFAGDTLLFKNGDANIGRLIGNTLTASRNWTLPDAAGEISLLGQSISSGEIDTIVESMHWPAGSFEVDGTNCTAPAASGNTLLPTRIVVCADNDAGDIYGHTIMPDSWDGGTVTFELSIIQVAASTQTIELDFAAKCVSSDEATSAWAASPTGEQAASITLTADNDMLQATTSAVTVDGTTCAGGDALFWTGQVDATASGADIATAVEILSVKMEYTSNVGD